MTGRGLFFCPCSENVQLGAALDPESLKLDTFPSTLSNKGTLHQLSHLSFCQYCQALKCRRCTEVEIVSKFCPRCMKPMGLEHTTCAKSCFDCPLCGCSLRISLDQEKRVYNLDCLSCEWKWNTGTLSKPRSLHRIVRDQVNNDPSALFFSKLQHSYAQREIPFVDDMNLEKQLLLQFEQLKVSDCLKDNDIHSFLEKTAIQKFDPITDEIKTLSTLSDNSSLLNYEKSITLPKEQRMKLNQLPKSTRLRTKSSKRCKACRTSLMKPDSDPLSTKFYKLSNAIDFIPSIEILAYPDSSSLRNHTNYLLILKNPLDIVMKINLSSSVEEEFPVRLYLPVSKFEIGAKPENSSKLDVFIKTIPFVQLSRNTKLSRVELMNRSQPNFDTLENIVEQNHNYIVIPVEISQAPTSTTPVRVPLFVSVQTDHFSTGFWSVLEFNV